MIMQWREEREEHQAAERRGSQIKERKFRQQELRYLQLILETKEENK